MNEKRRKIRRDDVLPSHMKLDIWEVYARLILQLIDPGAYSGLQHGDKPDLFDAETSIGVEVTQAISSNNQEADALYAKLRSTKDEKLREKLTERIEQVGAQVFEWGLFGPKGTDSFDLAMDAFCTKLTKLNNGGYKAFEHNHLLIRSDILADAMMLGEALTLFSERNDKAVKFERVIVTVPGHNYDFDLIRNMVHDKTFGSMDQYRIAEQARQIVIDADNSSR